LWGEQRGHGLVVIMAVLYANPDHPEEAMPASASSLIDSVRAHAGGDVRVDPAAAGPCLLEAFALVPDPRARRGVRHRLVTVLAVSVCAVLAGARSLIAIAEWAADLPEQVRGAVGIVAGPPCESTIRRVLGALDADRLDTVMGAWAAGQLPAPVGRRAVAVDGKTLRGSALTGSDQARSARHLLAAVDHDTRTVLGQVDVDGKTNEITAFAPLLDAVASAGVGLASVVVTADALHTQRDHVTYLHQRGAHWLLTVKGNQPKLHRQLRDLPWRAVDVAHRTTNRGHGRRETRSIKIVTIAAGIEFPHAAQAIQVVRRTQPLAGGRWRTETIYAVTSLAPQHASPAQIAAWTRGHRQIENALHWVRDVTYGEDHSQVRTGAAPQVMASLRNIAINALRLADVTNIAAALRHHARNPIRPLQLLKILH
jgi:predicted transposase YbfD/YdcC